MQRFWPRTLFGRLTLILVAGLVIAHGFSYALVMYQQAKHNKSAMLYSLGKDVVTAVAILDRLPPAERPAWLNKLERRNYRYQLGYVPKASR